jgi:predicted O-linked N-acetylglucosamine transferase (SPINDLY family)
MLQWLVAGGQFRLDEFIYIEAVNRQIDDSGYLRELFWLRFRQKEFRGACDVACYMHYIRAEVSEEIAIASLALMHICDWSRRDVVQTVLMDRIISGIPSIINVYALLASEDNPDLHKKMSSCIAEKIFPVSKRHTRLSARRITLKKERRLRIGYLCGNFNDHPTSMLMASVLEKHDRVNFEVFAYDYSPDINSPIRSRIIAACDHFVKLGGKSMAEIAALIRGDEVDILVDLCGYTEALYSEIVALRPAPVQVNFLGYIGSQGGDWIDYIIADPHVIPADQLALWPEKVVYMPGSYYPGDRSRPIPALKPQNSRSKYRLPESGFIFACFNSPHKITPDAFAVWMHILKMVPQSVLWLYKNNDFMAANLIFKAREFGVSPERLVFAEKLPFAQHMERHGCADLFLDTFPYGAHTTAADALWAGLPLITKRGRSFASRVSSSMLITLGLIDSVCATDDEYVRLAVTLATNPTRLADLRRRLLAARDVSSLFDATQFAANLERAFFTMAAANSRGDVAATIYL